MSCADRNGFARCKHCGAELRMQTIFNRDMQGFCKAWKYRHEKKCANWTPEQRRKWAKRYEKKDSLDSGILVDLSHEGFASTKEQAK